MVERVANILRYTIKEIVGSPLVLEFLSIYSQLYLFGKDPGNCDICMRKYYQELIKNGMDKAIRFEQVKSRTLVPAWNGLKYVPKAARHFSSVDMTDEEAINYLLSGQLRESDFEKLPEEYEAAFPKEDEKVEETEEVEETEQDEDQEETEQLTEEVEENEDSDETLKIELTEEEKKQVKKPRAKKA